MINVLTLVLVTCTVLNLWALYVSNGALKEMNRLTHQFVGCIELLKKVELIK